MAKKIRISAFNCARNLTFNNGRKTQWWWRMHFLRHDGNAKEALKAEGVSANEGVKIAHDGLVISEG